MFSGALVRLPEEIDIIRLDGLKWERRQGGQDLKSVIQFQGSIIRSGDIEAREALAIHESPGKQATIDESEGKYKISYIDVINTVWANIYVVPGFVVVDSLENRSFVRDIINKGLNPPKRAHDVVLNTARMAEDHAGQWIRSFSERRGRVDRGTVFGESVEQDSVFGPELVRSTSKTVGWTTNFFGSPVKVRVSPRGAVSVWSWPPVELFLKFIKVEILPYMISLD